MIKALQNMGGAPIPDQTNWNNQMCRGGNDLWCRKSFGEISAKAWKCHFAGLVPGVTVKILGVAFSRVVGDVGAVNGLFIQEKTLNI